MTLVTIEFKTEMTTRLDPDELIEETEIGHGSFGIVYKGEFRGHTVAIKKVKEMRQTKESIEEFEKEVAMLDKFRCEYIIHFYGAVFIPLKMCMVTEFAKYGSLQDLIMKRYKDKPIDEEVRIKILLDSAKGIQYLHSNGILHRDIKPDNFLIFDIEHHDNSFINAKLTDFGSSRNINMMMTNMTFSKGIGTPKYMSPEVLNKQHYKSPADIFSFAITMYEVMVWREAYPKELFRFEWDIADFICKGKRLEQVDINDNMYSLITQCWQQSPQERLSIGQVIIELQSL